MARLELSKGQHAIIDDCDVDAASKHRWHATESYSKNGRHIGWYAKTEIGRRTTYLHRWLLDAPVGTLVDHINGDKLDNRRANLRLCTRAQNCTNRVTPIGVTGFRGVFRDRHWFRARLWANGEVHRLGYFTTPEAAARAYDAGALRLHGEFACLNFPDSKGA